MKKLKIAGLLAVAVAALMAFAATASASTTLTSPKGTAYFGTLHANTEGHAILAPPGLPQIECDSTAEGEVTANGTPATIASKALTFGTSGCTNNWHVTTVAPGSLTIASGGTIRSNALTVEATRFGIVCRYVTANTEIGLITDSAKTGATATMHISGSIPFHNGSGLCGSGATKWTGSYKIDTPDALYVD
ncbi:MAG TPA: hypothetical protein VFS54_04125 [Solirubrobacterales bacterium]|nr:hypothetical protein [Solirubrobacterales bacterium]